MKPSSEKQFLSPVGPERAKAITKDEETLSPKEMEIAQKRYDVLNQGVKFTPEGGGMIARFMIPDVTDVDKKGKSIDTKGEDLGSAVLIKDEKGNIYILGLKKDLAVTLDPDTNLTKLYSTSDPEKKPVTDIEPEYISSISPDGQFSGDIPEKVADLITNSAMDAEERTIRFPSITFAVFHPEEKMISDTNAKYLEDLRGRQN